MVTLSDGTTTLERANRGVPKAQLRSRVEDVPVGILALKISSWISIAFTAANRLAWGRPCCPRDGFLRACDADHRSAPDDRTWRNAPIWCASLVLASTSAACSRRAR